MVAKKRQYVKLYLLEFVLATVVVAVVVVVVAAGLLSP